MAAPADCPSDLALSGYVAGDLPVPESTAVVNHIRNCARCSTRVNDLEQSVATDVLIGNLRKPHRASGPPDPEFRAAVEKLLAVPLVGPPTPGVGDVIDDYRLVEVLGEGGMGVVYRAVHTHLDREVALKVIRGSRSLDPQVANRFAREMKATGRVRHPNLVQATDAGVANGVQYLVMEYVRGTDLARLILRDGPLPLTRACDIIRQAASGLHHAHQNGLIHRDVKPSNLILGADGVVRVLDLGLALLPADEPTPESRPVSLPLHDTLQTTDDTLTSPDQKLGTRDYTAPEQLQDSHRVDHRADIYGLGCTLVYLLTGHAYQSRESPPVQLPGSIWDKFLSIDPEGRFATAQVIAEEIARYCSAQPSRRVFLTSVGVGLIGIGGVAGILLNRDRASTPPEISTSLPVAPHPRPLPARGTLPMTADGARKLQQVWADHLRKPVEVNNSLGMKLSLIPPGEFGMTENYQVKITRPYYLGRYEVTHSQYLQFMNDNPGHMTQAEIPLVPGDKRTVAYGMYMHFLPPQIPPVTRGPYSYRNPGWGEYEPDQPITYLTWNDAEKFLVWLSHKEKQNYRLPTHAEWVWACRAGTVTKFYWDEYSPDRNAYALTGLQRPGPTKPQRVGLLLPNAWNLHDMFGNVAEMVSDYHDHKPVIGHVTDPGGPPPGNLQRVICGGSYLSVAEFQFGNVPWKDAAQTNLAYSTVGFRVVMEP